MNIYIAGRYSRRKEFLNYAVDLQRLGHYITSRWLFGGYDYPFTDQPDRDATKDGLDTPERIEKAAKYADEDARDVVRADTFILFPLNPRELTDNRGGMHFETGIAWALGHRLIIIGVRQNIFHCLNDFEFYETWEEFYEKVSRAPALPDNDYLLQREYQSR